MVNEEETRRRLRTWIHKRAKLPASRVIEDDTPILDQGLLTSLDVAELFVYMESLLGSEIDISQVDPSVLRDINMLYASVFASPRPPPG